MSRSCKDCKGGVPAPQWTRCEKCAEDYLRVLMSEGRVLPTKPSRRYSRDTAVFVGGAISRPGVIVRVRDDQYTVKLDNGMRCYVTSELLKPIAPVAETSRMRIRRAKRPTSSRVDVDDFGQVLEAAPESERTG